MAASRHFLLRHPLRGCIALFSGQVQPMLTPCAQLLMKAFTIAKKGSWQQLLTDARWPITNLQGQPICCQRMADNLFINGKMPRRAFFHVLKGHILTSNQAKVSENSWLRSRNLCCSMSGSVSGSAGSYSNITAVP